jgi:uncharacterized protein (DUF362 family)
MSKVFIDNIKDDVNAVAARASVWVGMNKKVKKGDVVLLKPNLTYPKFKPGVTTTPKALEAFIRVLCDLGAKVIVGESDGGYNSYEVKDTYHDFGLFELENKYGIKVVNFSADKSTWRTVKIHKYMKDFFVEYPALLEDCDHFVTFPVPKMHAMTRISLSYKNQWGCVPNVMRLRYHPIFNEAIFAINQIPKSKFSVVDGTYGLTKFGPMTGNPIELGWLLVGDSMEASDLIVSKIMKVDLKGIAHYKKAFRAGLVPNIKDIEMNKDYKQFVSDRFYLKREIWTYPALFAWTHPWITHFFYESFAADLLHKIMYTFRKRPISD